MSARRSVTGIVVFAAILLAVWYVLSGKFDLLHFGTGVVTAVVIVLVARPPADTTPVRPGSLLRFLPWLLGQVILSNLRVVRVVLSPSLPIRPTLLRKPPRVRGGRALTMLGVSTTLTPGTLTIDVSDEEIQVHALDRRSVEDVRAGIMARRVARVFGQEER